MKKITILIIVCYGVIISLSSYSRLDDQGDFNIKKDTLTDLQILTDSTIKYAFGYNCSKSGMPPKGRQAIDRLIKLKDLKSIKSVLEGQNNVGKIYAIEALLVLASKEEFILSEIEKEKIKHLINQDYLIVRCEGCAFSSIKTIDLFNEKSYMKLLKDNQIRIKNR